MRTSLVIDPHTVVQKFVLSCLASNRGNSANEMSDMIDYASDILWKVNSEDDAEALQFAQMDTNELTIVKVIGHSGKPEQPSTTVFQCRCKKTKEVVNFAFRSCKHVVLVQEYNKRTAEVKPLAASVHYSLLKIRKKAKKLTSNMKGNKKFILLAVR